LVTNLLQEIRDLLGQILGDLPDSEHDLIENIANLIDNINTLLISIEQSASDTADNTETLTSQMVSQAQTIFQIYQAVMRCSYGVDNTHIHNIENNVAEIKVLVDGLASAIISMKQTVEAIANGIGESNSTLEAINNNAIAINANAGLSASFLEDIATNTLNSYNRETSIAADTTEIIALLRRLVDKVDPTVSEITNSLRNQRINPGERKLFVVDFSEILPEGYRISGIRGLNFTPGNEPLQPGESRQYQALDNRGFTTTGNGTKYQIAVYNYADSIVQFTLTVSAMIIKAEQI
jgi:hypothetical protein